MQHDKTKVYLTTIIAVVSIVFLVTLFINTIQPVDEGPVRPATADTQEEFPSDGPSAGQEEAPDKMRGSDGP